MKMENRLPTIETEVLKCGHCDHEWKPRKPEVNLCPECKRDIDEEVDVKVLVCGDCGHEWVPRKDTVYFCPECESLLDKVGYDIKVSSD